MAGKGQGWRGLWTPKGVFWPFLQSPKLPRGKSEGKVASLPLGAAGNSGDEVLLVEWVWTRPVVTTPAAAVAASIAPPRSSATGSAGWPARPNWPRGLSEPKQGRYHSTSPTPALGPSQRRDLRSIKGARPDALDSVGCTGRWQTGLDIRSRRDGGIADPIQTQGVCTGDYSQARRSRLQRRDHGATALWIRKQGKIVNNESSKSSGCSSKCLNDHRADP